MITPEQKQQFKTKLERELESLEQELDSFTKELQAAPGGHEAYIENGEKVSQEDEAQVSEEYAKRKALETVLEKRIEEIKNALDQIGTAAYGICSLCHAPIPLERLQINPAATTCIQCTK